MDRKNNQHTQRQQPTTMPILRYVIGIGMLVILLFWTENVAQASTTHADTLMIPLEQPTTTSTSRIHYVESNGDCGGVAPCYDTIQASVNASIAGDTIKIAQGTYTTLGLTVVYVTKGITLTGGYTNTNWDVAYPVTQTAVIDAENAPRRRGIYIDASNVSTVTLTGLTIQRGNANDRGAGIYSNYSHVVLRNNQILSNTTAYGGGIYAIRGSLSLYENLFLNNSGSYGGGIYANSSSTTMHHNTFQNNSGNDGAGIYLIHGIATLIDNIFEGNTGRTGGGIYLDGKSSSFLLKDNLFENNSASYGGAMSSAENGMTLINNTFRNNSASQLGGGMYLYKSHPTLYKNYYLNNSAQSGGGIHGFIIGEMTMIKNVIMDNRAEQYGGGIVISGSTGSIVRAENDIIANNSAINEGIYVASGSVIASHGFG
ncbi:MAG: right-handed parallel beta-helix repeat-containing protein, partial [Chloroflexota bacterium]